MFIDVVNAGWMPIDNLNLSEDVIGYMGAPAIALSYPWTHFICGHLGLLATRDDVAVHQQYIADIEASSKEVLASVNPVPFYVAAGENAWAWVKGYLDAVTECAAAPIIAKYTGVLAAADIEVFTTTTTFAINEPAAPGPRAERTRPPLNAIMQSLRLDRWRRADPSTPEQSEPGPGECPPRARVSIEQGGCPARSGAHLGAPRRVSLAKRRTPGALARWFRSGHPRPGIVVPAAARAAPGRSTDAPSQWLARSASSTSWRFSPIAWPRLSSALRIRYWTVFLCSISFSAVVL